MSTPPPTPPDDTSDGPPLPNFGDLWQMAQQVGTHARRLEDLEDWRKERIDDALSRRIKILEDARLEPRVLAIEQITSTMQDDVHTIMEALQEREKDTTLLADIKHDIAEVKIRQAQQDSIEEHRRERLRKISEAQETARKEAIHQAKQAKADADAIRAQVGSAISKVLLILVPILVTQLLGALSVNSTIRTVIYLAIVCSLVVWGSSMAVRYLRLRAARSRPDQDHLPPRYEGTEYDPIDDGGDVQP